MNNRSGYMIVLSFMLTAAIVTLVSLVFVRSAIFIPFSTTIIKREQARLLALSGLQLAISQLSGSTKEEENQKEESSQKTPEKRSGPAPSAKKRPAAEEEAITLLEALLPSLNRWQVVELDEKVDGIDGDIYYALSSEHGKININQIFDFEKGRFKGEWKNLLTELFKQTKVGSEQLIKGLEQFLAKRRLPLEDVTQLLEIKEFALFKDQQLYEPPTDKKKVKNRPLYLADIFTVSSGKSTLQPWLFSDSIVGLLGIKRAQVGDGAKREKMIDGWLKNFKLRTNWRQDWDTILKPLYEKTAEQLPKGLVSVLDYTFDPTVFSVVSYGTVGDTNQRLFATLERKKEVQGGKSVFTVTIKRIYWL